MTTALDRRSSRRAPLRAPAVRSARGVLSALLLAAATTLGVLVAAPASAVPPIQIEDEITDEVGALEGRTAEVQDALDELSAETEYQLYVVYVDSFDGQSPGDWTSASYEQSGLGTRDAVLAVAVEDRRYYFGIDTGASIYDDVSAISADVEDQLGSDDWAGAAITAAQGIQSAAGGGGAAAPDTSSGGGGGGFLTLLLVGALVIGGVLLIRTLSKGGKKGAPAPGQGPAAQPQGLAALPTQELDRRAASALVQVDDALRTSEQELGFAQAQFGIEATREFQQVLTQAKGQVTEAFHLRQILDDSTPDTEDTVRRTAIQILQICEQVAGALDAQTGKFDELRNLQARAPELLDSNETRAREISARIPQARRALEQLQASYPEPALASIRANPDQAEALLQEVHVTVERGRAALTEGDRPAAVNYARASENALGQAVTLLDAVDRAGSDLAAAGQRLQAAIASISSDLEDVGRLAPRSPDVFPRAEQARLAIEQAQAARTGGDPLAALRTITEAEAALDEVLASYREQDEHRRRADALLNDLLGRVDSRIRATADFITTRRGAVGPDARTRLAEAARLLQVAGQQRSSDPQAALGTAQQAEQLAYEAQMLAQADVEEQEQQMRYRGQGTNIGGNIGGMVLGGILIDSILRGGGGHGGGGFFGGGGGGGGFGGGGGGFGGGGFGGDGGGF